MRDEGWELLLAGRPREAIAKYRQMYSEHSSRGFLANIAIGHLCLGEVPAAAAEYAKLIAAKPHFTTGEYVGLGLCHWLSGEPETAISVWRDGLTCEMADGAGGVELPALLYFAAVRQPSLIETAEPTRLLKKRVRDRRSQYWPGPIAKYLLGQLTDQQLREAAFRDIAQVRERQEHQAEFYIGVRAEAEGRHDVYVEQMQKCSQASSCLLDDELYLARYEARAGRG